MMSRMFIAAVTVAASLVSAQSISSGCQSALTNVVASPQAACLNPSALVSLVVNNGNTSIIDPINTWLTGLCSAGSCSNDTLAAVVNNITAGCSNELSGLGISSGSNSQVVSVVQQVYPTARQIVCLKQGSTLCITQTLTNLQGVFGTLSANNIANIVSQAASSNMSIPTNVTCTDCVKQAVNVIKQAYPSDAASITAPLQSQCGSSFVDGATPTDISESAASGSHAPSSAALGSVSLLSGGALVGMTISTLVVVLSGMAFFA